MRTIVIVLGAILLAGCGFTSTVPARKLVCPEDTNRGECEVVANMAIDIMNRDAIGPIDSVTVVTQDCRRWGIASFRAELVTATRCWHIGIVGDDSRGGAIVWEEAGGRLLVQPGPGM